MADAVKEFMAALAANDILTTKRHKVGSVWWTTEWTDEEKAAILAALRKHYD